MHFNAGAPLSATPVGNDPGNPVTGLQPVKVMFGWPRIVRGSLQSAKPRGVKPKRVPSVQGLLSEKKVMKLRAAEVLRVAR